ncbi:DUF309 domain-containing protein [Paenibacillus sp. N1-5-1-14]|uniref:DUF309 domain-containing protein n=1 Tax=Paenibacillus radicibacter TaxID=2972488 RepID=UPI0021592B83|nr:DUF309 domain-containing protein [Paenibacillus radicibacter]MCR8643908.1 DUF309 domain-containing protein [Paenibacillus radicibacter]
MKHWDPLLIRFLYEFNKTRDYYECHDVMEELWLEEGRKPLYQGLLQVAVGLYHHGNGNVSGAIKLLRAAIEKLEPYADYILGIHLELLVQDASRYLHKLEGIDTAPFMPYDLDIHIVHPELLQAVEDLVINPPLKTNDE